MSDKITWWAAEDGGSPNDWIGSGCWGRNLNQNFLNYNMVSGITWSAIWSVYPNLPNYGHGLMNAVEPCMYTYIYIYIYIAAAVTLSRLLFSYLCLYLFAYLLALILLLVSFIYEYDDIK